MGRHVVIGTAGHVDHGKTALVKALTGTETDRWAEEQRRGITIDLGFAVLELGQHMTASVVDVPGHEDFVRNMVAGATGVDVALLVVAADEGMMPQTFEHLAILEFLGVKTGVTVVTKCDLVDDEWLEMVREDLVERLAESLVQWTHAEPVSVVTGQGVSELQPALRDAAQQSMAREEDDLFRLPVDRVFSVAGAGTVVTGTTWSGTVKVGDEVRVFPGNHRGRVRNVEVHGVTDTSARPGRRTALAIAGLDRKLVARGSVVVTGDWWRERSAIDVILTLLPDAKPITQRSRVRFHLGTSEVMARVTPVEPEIAPGTAGAARLRLERPLVCRWGDRGVVRSYSPVTTIGGCQVVDPWPAARPRRPVAASDRANGVPTERLAAFVRAEKTGTIDRHELPVRLGVRPSSIDEVLEGMAGFTLVDGVVVDPAVIAGARADTLHAVAAYHKQHPLRPGMPRALARRSMHEQLADAVHERLAADGLIVIEGDVVRLPEHKPKLRGMEQETADWVRAALQGAGGQGKTESELRTESGQDIGPVLEYLVRSEAATKVGRDRYYGSQELGALSKTVIETIASAGRASPAQLREATGLSRKYLIPLLEWMDARQLTMRDGDARQLGPKAAP